MPTSASVAPKKKAARTYDHAKYATDLRSFRKELGYTLVHWYIHETAYNALIKAAEREDRKIQQYVSLNIWNLVPEDLRPKVIPMDSLILPKKKKVRLTLKIPGKPKKEAN